MTGPKPVDRNHRPGGLERPSPGDFRTPAQHDRDRVLYSWAFRRLAGVTQVVPATEARVVHNRLTHSLKVAQVGRRLTEYLQHALADSAGELDSDIVETACLAHDLGHPPFGHTGEHALHKWLRGDEGASVVESEILRKEGFEGNAQSFRIVTKISLRKRGSSGLNLTAAALNAILKYPWAHGENPLNPRKYGFYETEREQFQEVRRGVDGISPSLEAAIMDHADDVTYAVHDLEDFYRAGYLPLDQLFDSKSETRSEFLSSSFVEKLRSEDLKDEVVSKGEIEERWDGLGALVTPELRKPYEGRKVQLEDMEDMVNHLLSRFLLVDSSDVRKDDTGSADPVLRINGGPDEGGPFLQIDREIRIEVGLLKKLMDAFVFHSPSLLTMQHGQKRIVTDLAKVYLKQVKSSKPNETFLPRWAADKVREINQNAGSRGNDKLTSEQATYQRERVAIDVATSLTDYQAIKIHEALTGRYDGHLLDPLVV